MESILSVLAKILRFQIYQGSTITITVGTIVFAIVVFFVTYLMLKVIKKGVVRVFAITDKGRIETVFNYISYFVYLIVFFSIISAIGVNINMFLTASAALFVGLGFALQQIFQDLIAGIYILFDKTLDVGDVIQIDGKVAKVKVINLRSTIAETRDRRIIVIPNRIFINDIIHNWTQDQNIIRASVEVKVYIGSDVQLVKEILLQSIKNVDNALEMPEPSVILEKFGESAIHFNLRYYTNDAYNNDLTASNIRFEIDRLFKENGILLSVPVVRLESKEAQSLS